MEKISHYAGIDVSSQWLDINMLCGGEQESCLRINNDNASIQKWIAGLPADTRCAFEATGVYSRKLEYWLSESSIPFRKLNPLKVHGFSSALGVLSKNDASCARDIRLFDQSVKGGFSPHLEASGIHKARCLQAIANLKRLLQNINNQVHVLEQEPIAIEVLRQSYEQIRQAIEEQISIIRADLDVMQGHGYKEEYQLLQSVVGIGPVCARAVLDAVGSLQAFSSKKKLAKFLGVAPVVIESGTTVRKKRGICGTAVPEVRAKLYMAATCAIRYNPVCRELYLRLRQNGKPKKVARIAVVNKLIQQMYAVAHSGKPFDPLHEEKKKETARRCPKTG